MADVQIDNGHFTQLANVLLEKVSSAKLNGCQHAIILQVWRYTYGFKRKEHELSAGFLAKATGYNQRQIQRDLIVLVDRNIIIQRVINGVSRTLSFNKDFDKWDTTYGELADGESTDGEIAVPPTANKTGVTYGELADQEIKSFKQNLKQNYLSQFEEFWKLYPSKKGKAKAQIKWLSLSPKMDFKKAIEGTKAYIAFIEHGKANGRNREYKDGATFVNQESWNDEWMISDVRTFRPTNKIQADTPFITVTDEQRRFLLDVDAKAAERNRVPRAVNE